MQVDEDERALQNIVIYDKLAAMGIETDNDKVKMTYTLSDHKLQKILKDNNEIEEEEIFIVDSNIDACVKSGSMPGKYIVDFMYLFQQLHEKFDKI